MLQGIYEAVSSTVRSTTRRSVLDFSAAKHNKWLRRLSSGPVNIWLASPVYNSTIEGDYWSAKIGNHTTEKKNGEKLWK